jgi:hypothetical protein
MDVTAVDALDKVIIKFRRQGTLVDITGKNEASATIVDRFGTHDKPDGITAASKSDAAGVHWSRCASTLKMHWEQSNR